MDEFEVVAHDGAAHVEASKLFDEAGGAVFDGADEVEGGVDFGVSGASFHITAAYNLG